jgi:hypothetical protein
MSEQLFCYKQRRLPNGKVITERVPFNENDADGVLTVMPRTFEAERNGRGPHDPSVVVDRLLQMSIEGQRLVEEQEAKERQDDRRLPKRVIEI